MAERILPNGHRGGERRPVLRRSGGGGEWPESPENRNAGRKNQRSEPDPAAVRALARELAAEFGRALITDNPRVWMPGSDAAARAVEVEASPGGPSAEIAAPPILEAVKSVSGGRFHPSSLIPLGGGPGPGSSDAGSIIRGNLLNVHA